MPRKSNFALRLPASLKTEAEQVAKEEGTTLNQLINIALAEKLAAWRTAKFFEERAARPDPAAWIVSWPALETSRRVRAMKFRKTLTLRPFANAWQR